ncbi:hypothetical protein AGR7A_Lc120011 [Agrobacterium deltaense NCPPB 1641]|uniref:Uncharacterized protein n=1 Tax=Agrobacterium deltaense NCPPB 1641 TaxID=1183425 RepID=A0A1S7TVA8_9HYPH|nr:hypothetical protein AGR7A_Lc120011 [Agrobacterium deltaense NCPPB 1641]
MFLKVTNTRWPRSIRCVISCNGLQSEAWGSWLLLIERWCIVFLAVRFVKVPGKVSFHISTQGVLWCSKEGRIR